MKDVLGREIKDGDMCVGMAIGKYSSGMHIGVARGCSVCYLSYGGTLRKSCTSNMYLIVNPTQQELELKQEIVHLLNEEDELKKKKTQMKTIPLGKLVIGGIYKSTNDDCWLYLGKRTVTLQDFAYRTEKSETGHCFAPVYLNDTESEMIASILFVSTYHREYRVSVIKGNKKLTELVRTIDIKFPLTEEIYGTRRPSELEMRLTIE